MSISKSVLLLLPIAIVSDSHGIPHHVWKSAKMGGKGWCERSDDKEGSQTIYCCFVCWGAIRGQLGGGRLTKRGDISEKSAPHSHLLKRCWYFFRVNCRQETFLKVVNKAIYLEPGNTVVHVEGGILKIHNQLLSSSKLSFHKSKLPASPPQQGEKYWLHNLGLSARRLPSSG